MRTGWNPVFLLPQAIVRAAEHFPDREAIRFSDNSLTYAELVVQANSLAQVLRDQGVGRGDRVGIYMNKGVESAVAVYGIMQAGAAYVPLDPFAPVSRLNFVIRDCNIHCLVTKLAKLSELRQMIEAQIGLECLVGLPTQESLPVRCLSWDDALSRSNESFSGTNVIEQDLAYILYTSGSTGDPKGIMHTHRSGLSFAEWAATTCGLHHEDRLSNHAPLHFDLSTLDFFAGALAAAATVVIPEAVTKFPANLSKLIQDERISVWYSVPFALIQLLLRGGS
jgi:non-ribosomal peptide synthetase component F